MSLQDDLRAAAAADRELGRDYEPAVLDAFVERVGRELDRRADDRAGAVRRPHVDWTLLLLALGSFGMGLGVPGAFHDKFGTGATFVLTVFCWAAIVAVNVVALRERRRR